MYMVRLASDPDRTVLSTRYWPTCTLFWPRYCPACIIWRKPNWLSVPYVQDSALPVPYVQGIVLYAPYVHDSGCTILCKRDCPACTKCTWYCRPCLYQCTRYCPAYTILCTKDCQYYDLGTDLSVPNFNVQTNNYITDTMNWEFKKKNKHETTLTTRRERK